MNASAALLVGTAALAALPIARGGGPLFWRVGVALVVWLACAAGASLPTDALTAPLLAQAQGQGPLVVARAALAVGALLLVPLTPRAQRRALAALLASALLASWAAQLALLPLAALYSFTAVRARRLLGPQARAPVWVALALGVIGALALAVRAPPPGPPLDDREAALRWEARDNPWRALPHARAWAAQEQIPGAGVLCLARLAHRLGDHDEARALAARVTSSPDAALRDEATRLAQEPR